MKKTISISLAILTVISFSLHFNRIVSAEGSDVYVITNCDTAENFSRVDPEIALDTTVKSEGTGSMAINPAGGAAGAFGIRYDLPAAVDITQYSYLEFELYIKDSAALKAQASVYSPLRLFDDQGRAIIYVLDFTGMQTGWNHIKIKLSEKTDADPTADWTKIKVLMFHYLYYEGDPADDANRRAIEGLTMNFDNICLVNDPQPSETAVITHCDSLDNFTRVDPEIALDTTEKAEGSGSLVINPQGGAAGAFGMRYDHPTTIDITKYTYLEFELFIKDAAALKPQASVYSPLRLFDDQGRAIIYVMDFTNLQTGWNHIKIKLSEKTDADPTADWTKIKAMMFHYLYYEGDPSDDANRRAIEGLTMNFDNIRLTNYGTVSSEDSSSVSSSSQSSSTPESSSTAESSTVANPTSAAQDNVNTGDSVPYFAGILLVAAVLAAIGIKRKTGKVQ